MHFTDTPYLLLKEFAETATLRNYVTGGHGRTLALLTLALTVMT